MLNILGINSNTPIKLVLGLILVVVGVTQHTIFLLAAGVVVLLAGLVSLRTRE